MTTGAPAHAASRTPDLRPFVDGAHVDSSDAAQLDSIDPTNGGVLWSLPVGTAHDVDLAVTAARRALAGGAWRDSAVRLEVLHRLADLVEGHTHDLALLDTLEVGIPLGITTADVPAAAQIARDLLAMVPEVASDAVPPSQRVPRGVVAVISPWNFPFFVAFTKVMPILAMGNCVVLKPSEISSASAMLLAELAIDAGMPAGVLNVVAGSGHVVGDALVRHPDIDQVNLTGSLATGRRVLAATAESNLAPVLTELGGKSAHVVTECAPDLDVVADAIAASIFWAGGQVCTAGARLIVHERHHDALVERIVERATQWRPGDPMDTANQAGPLATEAHRSSVDRAVRRAVDDGGRVVCGGVVVDGPGWYYEPTVVDGVEPDHRLFLDEVFGPVLAVTTCTSTAHAIELANATHYGLSATGWSDDVAEAQALADGLRAAWVSVNPHLDPPSDPRAGAESLGWSGSGVEGGLPALRAATRLTVVAVGAPTPGGRTPEEQS